MVLSHGDSWHSQSSISVMDDDNDDVKVQTYHFFHFLFFLGGTEVT